MLSKSFSPAKTEPRLYELWERSGAFAADPRSEQQPFTVMIPPPNVTGSLHMGHALTFTVQDTLVRFRRMQGRDALWQPGTDHAGIATQMVVERLLAAEGTDRRALGRDGFTGRVWQWKAESGGSITRQLRRLGASLDWPRERFTMDEGLSAAVRETFVTLHRQGLIYRDRRLVNWDPVFQSAISDLEVEAVETRGSLWYIRYPLEAAPGVPAWLPAPAQPGEADAPHATAGGAAVGETPGFGAGAAQARPPAGGPAPDARAAGESGGGKAADTEAASDAAPTTSDPAQPAERLWITVATTRPETLLGDVAVAVNPEDARYRHLVGRHVILPLNGRRIPIVADEHSDPAKGSGAVKITPAHDFNDFAVGQRHALPMPTVLDAEARITLAELELASVPGLADPAFTAGLDGLAREPARAAILAELARLGLLERTEPHTLQVPHAERGGAVVEPRLTTQWYVNAAELARPAIAAVEQGRTRFVPAQWENTFFAWMRDIQPWCISRQLWWGHRIPAWYGPDGHVFVERTEVEAAAAARTHYGCDEPLARDEDVLDTWFSSGLWPFSTLGWPERTPELARYYPGDVLVTGFDIIFFWVARMMMLGLHLMGEVPFRTVYIHGLVRDERGAKMSKSKGNVIDPLALIDRFGTDALRFAIASLTGPGRDVKLGPARVESARSFVTKLWNAARFCEMNAVVPLPGFDPAAVRSALCRWAIDAANAATLEATAALEAYRLNDYAAACYRFAWNTLCDWLLEFAKPVLFGTDAAAQAELRGTIAHVLGVLLRLLHPMMPFVTEELWGAMGFGPEGSLIRAPWPVPVPVMEAEAAREELDWVVRLIGLVRTVRAEMNVPASLTTPVLLRDAGAQSLARAERWIEPIRRLARVEQLSVLDGAFPAGAAQAVLGEATLVLPLAGLIDLPAERARLQKEQGRAAGEADKLARKLANPDFTGRARPEVVEETRERLASAREEEGRLGAALARLG